MFTRYCDVQGGYAGVSNINSDPLFVNPAAGNFRIPRMSPCRDTGNTSLLLMDILDVNGNMVLNEQLPIDIYDEPRVVGIVDIGADETRPGDIGTGGEFGDDRDPQDLTNSLTATDTLSVHTGLPAEFQPVAFC